MEKFVLEDGYISMNNEQLFLDIKTTKNDIKSRGGWLGVFLTFVAISVFHTIKNIEKLSTFFDYFDFGLQILGGITIIAIFYYLIFLRKSKKNLLIRDLAKITLSKKEFTTDAVLTFHNKRELDLHFRNLENQLEPFINEVKKRNTRIIIEN